MICLYGLYDNWWEVEQNHFPDGALHLNLPDERITAIEWNYESDAELFTLICIAKHYNDPEIYLCLPYVPHARMDRVKESEDVFTLKYFCEVINSLNFKQVVILDPHSNVASALLDRVVVRNVNENIARAVNAVLAQETGWTGSKNRKTLYENFIFFFPDEGAMKRYSANSPVPYTFGIKTRDWKTGKIQGYHIVNPDLVAGKTILIVDDICSRGGTFLHSAKALKEAGAAHIYLYITHAEKTMVEGEMYNTPDLIEKIITTESIFKTEWDVLHKVNVIQNY